MIRKAKSSYDRRIAEKKFRWSQELLESCEESPSPNPNKSVTPQPSASSWVYHSTWKNNHACPYYCERFLLKVSAIVSASILQMLWRNCFLTFHLRTGTNWAQKHVCIFQVNLCSLWNRYQLRLWIVDLGCLKHRKVQDGIPARLRASQLLRLCRRSGNMQGWFPFIKMGIRKCIDNYRPISILTVASRILEGAVEIQLL